jgi:hypothetical protein
LPMRHGLPSHAVLAPLRLVQVLVSSSVPAMGTIIFQRDFPGKPSEPYVIDLQGHVYVGSAVSFVGFVRSPLIQAKSKSLSKNASAAVCRLLPWPKKPTQSSLDGYKLRPLYPESGHLKQRWIKRFAQRFS